ncbi:MAG: serine hydrolase [Gemmatimonadota bacterium]
MTRSTAGATEARGETASGPWTRRRRAWAAVAVGAALALLAGCGGESTGPAEALTLEERLDAALVDGFAASDGIGFGASVWVPDRSVWTGVAGVSHANVPITPATAFAAGSITKVFTAVTLLRLAEEGRVSLDDSLHSWLPAYPNTDPDITLRQLLSHTSGLSDFTDPDGWFAALLVDPGRQWDLEEYYVETIREPYFEKGTAWSYSTSGYLLLRRIIELASGRTLAGAYHHYIIGPAGLEHTYVCPDDPHPADRAHGWLDLTGDGAYDDLSLLSTTAFCSAAGGQVFTTSRDLVTLGRALMRDRTLLQPASYQSMTDFHIPHGHDEPMVRGYGLGLMWFSPEFVNGVDHVWGHGGNAPGYAAGMLYLVDHDVIIGITDNTEQGEAIESVAYRLMDVVHDHRF